MKVILNDYIEHLGERGDTVEVKPGYARNYLVPKGLAYSDSPGSRRRFQQEQKRWENMNLKRLGDAEQEVSAMEGVELVFERRAGEKDVLFGSVNALDIVRELDERGLQVDKKRVLLAEPIKALGNFQVEIHVHREIKVTIQVWVVRPGEQPQRETDEAAVETTAVETAAVETAAAA